MARTRRTIPEEIPAPARTRRGTKLNDGLALYRGITNASDENMKLPLKAISLWSNTQVKAAQISIPDAMKAQNFTFH
jgi:hypothetical protein